MQAAGRTSVDRASRGPSDFFFSAILFVLALLPRIYVAIAWPREPVWDGHYYDFGARRIAAGLGYSDGTVTWHPWCHWPVGYSGVLAAMYKMFGTGSHVATIFNAVTGALLAVFVHRFARYELSSTRARIAGLLCAFFPGLIMYSALIMTEPLAALVTVVAGWVWVKNRATRPALGAVLFGITLGLGALVHPVFIAYAPALLLITGDTLRTSLAGGKLLRSLALAGLAVASALAPVLPWTLRNCLVMDRCALVSTNGGWNLAIGAFPRATGRFETLHATDGCAVVTGQVEQDTCFRDLALRNIRAEPGRWLGLVPKKLAYTFDHESFPVEYLHEADPDRWPEERRREARAWLTGLYRALLTAAVFVLAPFPTRAKKPMALFVSALLSLVVFVWLSDSAPFYLLVVVTLLFGYLPLRGSAPRGPVLRWALFCVFGTAITHAVFFGEDRYHVVVTPLLCLLAAGALRTHDQPTSAVNLPHAA